MTDSSVKLLLKDITCRVKEEGCVILSSTHLETEPEPEPEPAFFKKNEDFLQLIASNGFLIQNPNAEDKEVDVKDLKIGLDEIEKLN